MRRLFYHVVTALLLKVVGEDAPLNETAEIERRALEERRTSPGYVRGKEVRRRGYARYRFLKGFKVSLRGVVYGLEWVTVSLPVLYRGEGEDEGGGVAQGGETGAQGPPPARVGNAKLWTQELEVRGDFKYVIVDGKYVKLKGGMKGCSRSRWDSRRTV